MGFSWSPFIAQCVSTALVTNGLKWNHDAWTRDSIIRIRNEANEVIAFVLIFYDNFLVVADRETTRAAIIANFVANAKASRAVVKGATVADPRAGVKCSNMGDTTEFLGVRFIRQGHQELSYGSIQTATSRAV
jgi:hypothetical protein